MKKTAAQLDREIASVLGTSQRVKGTRARKPAETPFALRTRRLKNLRSAMEDAEGNEAWAETDLDKLEGWIYVDDSLSDVAWQREAMKQLQDQSVLPEHVGAPSPNVFAWNDAFISTYRMNIDDGMKPDEAADSARENAFQTVQLDKTEREQIKTDPALYKRSR